MRETIASIAAVVIILVGTLASADSAQDQARSHFINQFPKTAVDSFSQSPIPGLYEVISGNQVFYFNDETKYLLFGEIYNNAGTSLTAERKGRLVAAKLDKLPLDKAVKIGKGPVKVIEFTDPDCPFCRKMDEFLSARSDVTRYVFFYPLPMHPNSKSKAAFIVASADCEKAFHDVFGGKYDKQDVMAADMPHTDLAMSQVEEMQKLGNAIDIKGTPMLWVEGQPVNGADVEKMKKLLSVAASNR
jgi:thiol:disulfide interchange protein DsbC